jgi:hypothetical protein
MISRVCVSDADGNEPLVFDNVDEVFFINAETHSSALALAHKSETEHTVFVNARIALAVELS